MNSGYCMFELTYEELRQCYENWVDNEDDPISKSERYWRDKLLKLCQDIVKNYGDDNKEV